MTELMEKEARRLVEGGISVIPVKADGTKAPAVRWKDYQSRPATPGELRKWFHLGRYGLGAVAGEISGNLEIIDFDDPSSFGPWEALVKEISGARSIEELPIVITPSGGYHVYFRCKGGVQGNQKLAQRRGPEGRPEVMIETRGEGGYTILPGSPPKCHPAKQGYFLVQGDLAKIPAVSVEERSLLLESARALNEYADPKRVISGPSSSTGGRPGDDFNARADWVEILEPQGWQKAGHPGEKTFWRRPGKKTGISATTNFAGIDLFYNFSTNGHPFEPGASYTKFAVYALLTHDGDFSAAAADLRDQGYGQGASSASSSYSASYDHYPYPTSLAEAAFYGLAGDIIRTIEPHTEADPSGLLVQLFTAFGNVIGRGPHFLVEATPHFTNVSTVLVGETSKSRKGTSYGHIIKVTKGVDKDWVNNRIRNGLSSGEGLIWAVRDPMPGDPGVQDKRLLVVESEFASTLKVMRREGNTLSPVIRNAWDTGDLNILTKNSPAKATGAHISIIGHIRRGELLRYLDSTEAGNGFGNRHLFTCVRRSKCLPEGGNLKDSDLEPLIDRLRETVEFSQAVGDFRIKFDEEARALWYEVYPNLSEGKPGLLGAMTARAEAQVIRLGCIYALLDISLEIRVEHLKAALAVWDYCEASCRYIFGDKLGDPVADGLLKALHGSGTEGMTRTDINKLFKGHRLSNEIGRALHLLESLGLARQKTQETRGRHVELWFTT